MRRTVICAAVLMLLVAVAINISAGETSADAMQKLQKLFQEAMKTYESKDYPKAITLLEQILEKQPNPMNALLVEYNLACAYAQSGKKKEALDHLEKAVALGFISAEQIKNDSDLDSLRESPRYSAVIKKAEALMEAQKKAVANIPEPKALFLRPKEVKKEHKTPLLIFLHGMGSSPKEVESTLAPLTQAWQYSIFLPCGSVKMGMRPDGKPAYNWDISKDPKEIIREVKKMKGIAQNQIYLTGFSAGASVSYLIALGAPDVFAGVIAFSGAVQKELLPEEKVKKASGKIPFYIVHGNQDAMMPISLGKNAQDYLKKHGFRVTLKEFDGGHTLPRDYFNIIKEAIGWFHKQPATK